jgi:hypothetical protein
LVHFLPIWYIFLGLKKRGCPGWGANPGPLNIIYFLIFHHFTTEPQRLPTFFWFGTTYKHKSGNPGLDQSESFVLSRGSQVLAASFASLATFATFTGSL